MASGIDDASFLPSPRQGDEAGGVCESLDSFRRSFYSRKCLDDAAKFVRGCLGDVIRLFRFISEPIHFLLNRTIHQC